MCTYRRSLLSFSFAVLLVLLFSRALEGQAKTAVADPYAGESFVIDRSDWVYLNNADGTGYREHTVAVRVQSEASLRVFGVVAVGFASASEHVELHYARVKHKDGSVTETPTSGALEQPEEVTRQAPFYSDLKEMQLPIKNLQVGDTLEWQARIVRTRAEAPGQFWGAETFVDEGAVTKEETIELRVPEASGATVWTNPRVGVTPVVTSDSGMKVYTWTSSQLKPTTGADAEAAKKAKKSKVLTADEETDAEQGRLPAVAWTSFKSWEAVGSWYRKLEGERAAPDDEIKAKVAELTAGKTTEEEKVRAVYAYVSAQIRYVGVAFGVGRFQPHEAADVLHNQYGDCKDKATLLTAMLGALGLPSDAVLIGDGVRFNEAVPSPASFNHLITRVRIGGNEVWLDATQEVAPYKVLLAELRDKQALVVPATGAATIERTPKELPFPAVITWKAVGTLSKDGVTESHITLTTRGDDEVIFRAVVHQVAPANYEELVQKLAQNFGYAGTTSHADLSRPEDTAEPFVISFNYHREKSGDWDNLRIVPEVAPVQLPLVDEKEPPVQSIALGTPRTELSNAELKLPEGWGVELPEAVHQKAAWATYDMTYRFDKGTIYTERKVVVLQPKVPAADWKAYKKWTDAISLGMENYIVLKPGAGGKVTVAPKVSENNAEVQELMGQIQAEFTRKDAQGMERDLKEVRSLDPKARRLWASEAALAWLYGKPSEAIADDRKELAMYPDEVDLWAGIVYFQQLQRDRAGAEETLRQWAKAAPNDPKPLTALSAALMQDKRNDDAMAAANEAVGRSEAGTTEGNQARLQFGKAAIAAGKNDKGAAALVELLKGSDDPLMLNDAAYSLADAKLEMPLAEASERKALETLTAETASWTLDENPETLRAKTSLLLASWDTMGWILYREGKFAEAESWLEAARLGRPDAEVLGHVAKVRAALKDAGSKTSDPDAGKSEQQVRTVPLGASGGKTGVAEYRLLLAHGHVERAEATGDERIVGGEELLKKANMERFFPKDSEAKLVRSGMVNCVAGKCDLVLEP
jgi:tetratricopeptide (TPR) repeat protein